MGGFSSVAADIRPPQPSNNDALQMAGRFMNLQEGIALMQQRKLAAQKAQQDQNEANTLMRAYAQSGNDIPKLRGILAGQNVDPAKVEGLIQHITQTDQQTALMDQEKFKLGTARLDKVASVLQPLKDAPEDKYGELYQSAYDDLLRTGFTPPDLAQYGLNAGAPPDKNHIANLTNYALGLAENMKQGREAANRAEEAQLHATELANKKAAEARAVETQAVELPTKQAEMEQKQRANAVSRLLAAKTEEQYMATLGDLPHKVALQMPQTFDDNTKAALYAVGTSPEQTRAAEIQANKEAPERNPTEASLAAIATDPNQPKEKREAAKAAIALLKQKVAGTGGLTIPQKLAIENGKNKGMLESSEKLATELKNIEINKANLSDAEKAQAREDALAEHVNRTQQAQDAYERDIMVADPNAQVVHTVWTKDMLRGARGAPSAAPTSAAPRAAATQPVSQNATVTLQAPDGSRKVVSTADADWYVKRGAKIVQ